MKRGSQCLISPAASAIVLAVSAVAAFIRRGIGLGGSSLLGEGPPRARRVGERENPSLLPDIAEPPDFAEDGSSDSSSSESDSGCGTRTTVSDGKRAPYCIRLRQNH